MRMVWAPTATAAWISGPMPRVEFERVKRLGGSIANPRTGPIDHRQLHFGVPPPAGAHRAVGGVHGGRDAPVARPGRR